MLLIVQNDPEVPPGLLLEIVRRKNVPHRVARPFAGEGLPGAADAGGVVVLGGRMGAGDTREHPFLADVRRLMSDAVERGVPLLGICLGGQMMADLFGGSVRSRHRGEKGIRRITLTALGCGDPLFHDVPYEFTSFQWHDDSFEIPESSVLLARNSHCPNQAFRHDASAYGVQFHPEADRDTVAAWAKEAGHPDLLEEFDCSEAAHRRSGEAIFGNFLRLAGHPS